MFDLKNDEILICFLLIILGYCIAKMFSRRCEGFNVGAKACEERIPKHVGIPLSQEVDECLFEDGNKTLCTFTKNPIFQNQCTPYESDNPNPINKLPRSCDEITKQADVAWYTLSDYERANLCKKYSTLVGNGQTCAYDYYFHNGTEFPTCINLCPLSGGTPSDPKCSDPNS